MRSSTIDAERLETRSAQLGVEPGERLSGAFPLGDGQGAAKILDVQALLAETFARRARPNHSNASAQRQRDPARRNRAEERETFVTFDVAGQEFALDLGLVQEIIALPGAIAAAPRADEAVAGMMALREQLLPLLSMRELLGFAPAPISEVRAKIIVASVGGALVGLVADRARAVIAADPALIDPVPPVIQARAGGEARIKSIYRGEEGRRLVSILAPEQLFRGDVMKRLGEARDASRPQPQIDEASEERKFLVFRLGDDEFGLPVEAVDEVARAPDRITRVPKAPKFLEGVINLRGAVRPGGRSAAAFRYAAARTGRRASACRCSNRTPPRGPDRRQRFRSAAYDGRRHQGRARPDRGHRTACSRRGQYRGGRDASFSFWILPNF